MKKTNKITILVVILLILCSVIFPQFYLKSGKVFNLSLNEFSTNISALVQKYEDISNHNEIIFSKDNIIEFNDEFFISKEEFASKTNLNVEYNSNKLVLSQNSELLNAFTDFDKVEIDLSDNLAFQDINELDDDAEILNFKEEVTYLPIKNICDNIKINYQSTENELVLSSPFASGRLIAISRSNFENYGACEVVSGYKDYFILQYNSLKQAKDAYEKILSNKNIISIQPDVKVYANAEVQEISEKERADLLSSGYKSWGVDAIGADEYSNYLSNISNQQNLNEVIVAVLDTGIDTDHEMLKDRIVSGGKSFVADESTIEDENGHGTHVSGTIVDLTLSNVKILPIKVLGSNGKGYSSYFINALEYCIEQKQSKPNLKLINMSLGLYSTVSSVNNLITSVVNNALDAGILSITASGNDNASTNNNYPASVENAVTVGSVGKSGTNFYRSSFSNYGTHLDFCAPGERILSAYLNNKYAYMSGTSMASPHIAGVYALMLSDSINNYSFSEIETLLIQNAMDLGTTGKDIYFGYGLVMLDNINIGECQEISFSVLEENFENEFYLSLTCEDENSVIYYTLDASNPSSLNGIKYSSPILISTTVTVKAIAYVFDSNGIIIKMSKIASKTYYHKLVEKDTNFVVNESGELTNYLGDMARFKVPEKVNGKTVVGVDAGAFKNNRNIEAVYLPDTCITIKDSAFYGCTNLILISGQGVESIGAYAFYATAIESLTDEHFPKLKEIDRYAFYLTDKLKEISLKNVEKAGAYSFATLLNNENLISVELENIKELSNNIFSGRVALKSIICPHIEILRTGALRGTAIEKVEFPLLKIVGLSVFENCEQLNEINLPEVIDVGTYAFSNCSKLNAINLPKVKKIGSGAFSNCSNLVTFNAENLQYLLNYVFEKCSKLYSVKIESLKVVGIGCFEDCKQIKSLSMPNVLEIAEGAFYGCSGLTSCKISPSVQKIGEDAFAGVSRYLTIISSPDNAEIKKLMQENATFSLGVDPNFNNMDLNYIINFAGSGVTILGLNTEYDGEELIIPAEINGIPVIKIADNAFKNNAKIHQINLPYVLEIGDNAFSTCANLNCAYMPNIKTIGENAFSGCNKLESVNIYNVKEIKNFAFFNCEKLLSMELGENVEIIGEKAIGYVNKGGEVVVNPLFTLNVCENTAKEYAETNSVTFQFRYLTDNYEIIYTIKQTNLGELYAEVSEVIETKYEEEISVPETFGSYEVKAIGEQAFKGTTFKRVKLPTTILEVGTEAFAFCENLVDIEMPNIILISSSSFYCCSNLSRVYAPKLKQIGASSFAYCTNLSEFLAYDLQTMQTSAFNYCVKLSTIKLPNLVYFGMYVFTNSGIKHIYLGDKLSQGYLNTYLNKDNLNATIYSYPNSNAQTFAEEQDINFVAISNFEFISEQENILNAICGVEINLSPKVGGVLDKLEVYVGNYEDKTDSVLFGSSVSNQIQININESGKKYAYFIAYDWQGNQIESNVFEINLLGENTIYVQKIGNGNLNFEGCKEIGINQSFKLTLSEITGYYLKDILINHQSIGESEVGIALTSGLEFSEITSPQNVQVIFEIIKYEINATSSEGGEITNSGKKEFEYSSNVTYLFLPNKGYEIDYIKVDGVQLINEDLINAIQNGFTFENITENHSIEVKYKLKEFEVNITTGENGSFQLTGNTGKKYGENIEISILANVGYELKSVMINGEDKTNLVQNNILTLTQEDHALNIHIEFKEQVFSINVKVQGKGKYELSSNEEINYGESCTIKVISEEGYKIYEVKVGKKVVTLNQDGEYEIENITKDIDIELIFKSNFEIFLINLFSNPILCLSIAGGLILLVVILTIIIKRKRNNKHL